MKEYSKCGILLNRWEAIIYSALIAASVSYIVNHGIGSADYTFSIYFGLAVFIGVYIFFAFKLTQQLKVNNENGYIKYRERQSPFAKIRTRIYKTSDVRYVRLITRSEIIYSGRPPIPQENYYYPVHLVFKGGNYYEITVTEYRSFAEKKAKEFAGIFGTNIKSDSYSEP